MSGAEADLDELIFEDPDLVGQNAELVAVSSGSGAAIQAQALSETEGAIGPLAFTHASVQRCPLAAKRPRKAPDPRDPAKIPRALELGVFFDGTNNNLLSKSKVVTNVGRLFSLYKIGPDPDKDIDRFALYVRGVGSLDEDLLHANAQKLGKALGEAKTKRQQALSAFMNAADPHKTSTANLQAHPELVRQYKDADETTAKLERKIAERRKAYKLNSAGGGVGLGAVDRIKIAADWIKTKAVPGTYDTVTIDVFGFSRGAATARSFINGFRQWTKKQIEPGPGKTTPTMPVTMRFLGIFDTVASFEITYRSSMTGHNLYLGDCEARVYHITAADEFRYNFMLTPAGAGEEISISGAHSDIGGGYDEASDEKDRQQLRDPKDPNFRKTYEIGDITLALMHAKALANGAPFRPISEAKLRAKAGDLTIARQREEKFRGSNARHIVWNTAFEVGSDVTRPYIKPKDIENTYSVKTSSEDNTHEAMVFLNRYIHFSFIRGASTDFSVRKFAANRLYNIDEMNDADWKRRNEDSKRLANLFDKTTIGARRDTVVASRKNPGPEEFTWVVPPDPNSDLVGD